MEKQSILKTSSSMSPEWVPFVGHILNGKTKHFKDQFFHVASMLSICGTHYEWKNEAF